VHHVDHRLRLSGQAADCAASAVPVTTTAVVVRPRLDVAAILYHRYHPSKQAPRVPMKADAALPSRGQGKQENPKVRARVFFLSRHVSARVTVGRCVALGYGHIDDSYAARSAAATWDMEIGLVPVTIPEMLRMLRGTVIPPPRRDRAHRQHWSQWRRRHQYRA